MPTPRLTPDVLVWLLQVVAGDLEGTQLTRADALKAADALIDLAADSERIAAEHADESPRPNAHDKTADFYLAAARLLQDEEASIRDRTA